MKQQKSLTTLIGMLLGYALLIACVFVLLIFGYAAGAMLFTALCLGLIVLFIVMQLPDFVRQLRTPL